MISKRTTKTELVNHIKRLSRMLSMHSLLFRRRVDSVFMFNNSTEFFILKVRANESEKKIASYSISGCVSGGKKDMRCRPSLYYGMLYSSNTSNGSAKFVTN